MYEVRLGKGKEVSTVEEKGGRVENRDRTRVGVEGGMGKGRQRKEEGKRKGKDQEGQ